MNLKKPKFWDYKYLNIYAYLLSPIAFFIKTFNYFVKKNKVKNLKIRTICVGNFYLGGTGKTSLSIKINKILSENKIKSCFIKKTYKNQIDEQELLKKNGKLFLSNKRIDAAKKAESENYDIAIFDDGLQDNSINYDLSFVCFNNINWIGNGMTIPAGPLRESLVNLKNYNHVFLNGNLENLEIIKKKIISINPNINIHLGRYKILNIEEFNKSHNYLVFSGIGNHKTFISMLKNNGFNIIKDIEFPDHYNYRSNDLNHILKKSDELKCNLITTEKDYLRLENSYSNKIRFIRTELEIIDEDKLIKSIL